ncbi:MAG: hypothetical protein PVJ31_07950 [Methyloceanibacter sp.]
MKTIAPIIFAGLIALSMAGCAVEVPLSAFRLGTPGTEQAPTQKPQPERSNPNGQ